MRGCVLTKPTLSLELQPRQQHTLGVSPVWHSGGRVGEDVSRVALVPLEAS